VGTAGLAGAAGLADTREPLSEAGIPVFFFPVPALVAVPLIGDAVATLDPCVLELWPDFLTSCVVLAATMPLLSRDDRELLDPLPFSCEL
jgi:hypothetical protein